MIVACSYNIHWGLGVDSKYDLKRISEIIIEAKADVIGI